MYGPPGRFRRGPPFCVILARRLRRANLVGQIGVRGGFIMSLRNRTIAAGAIFMITGGGATAWAQEQPANVAWESKTVPIEVLAQFPMITQPRMSPDGKWIAT